MKFYSMLATPRKFYGVYNQWGRHISCAWTKNNRNVYLVFKELAYPTRGYSSDSDDKPKYENVTVAQVKGREVKCPPEEDPLGWQRPPWRPDCPQEQPFGSTDVYRINMAERVVPPLPKPFSDPKPMLDCAKVRSPCAPVPCPPPPPCRKPPKRPFPWKYPIMLLAALTLIGVIYKIFLWQEERQRKIEKMKRVAKKRNLMKRPQQGTDLPPCVQYLIIGSGTAAWAGYEAIKELDKTAKVFFISMDDVFPYDRTPLSKEMWFGGNPPDLKSLKYVRDEARKSMYFTPCTSFLDPVKFYRKKYGPAVGVALGWCVQRIDADDHCVYVSTNEGEQAIYYERALFAPGSKARNLSIFKTAPRAVRDKVCRLRSVRDLEMSYQRVRDASHVTIIGGGHVGVELAYYLGRMYKEMHPPPKDEDEKPTQILHVYKDKGILGGILPEYLGEWAAEVLKCETVNVMPKTQVYDVFLAKDGSGKLQLTLSNGKTVLTDYVFLCVGAKPRTDLGKISELEIDKKNGGFLVNTEMEARKHLYVAGDAASTFSQWKRQRMRFEHATNAAETGQIAGANMTGTWTPCNVEPYWRVALGKDFEMEVVGEVGACLPTVGIFKPCHKLYPNPPTTTANDKDAPVRPCYKTTWDYKLRYKHGMIFYLRNNKVVGIIFWNFPRIEDRKEVATEILRAKPTWQDINVIAELLGFPQEVTCLPKVEQQQAGGGDDASCVSIKDGVSKWIPYEQYEKYRMLTKAEIPEIVMVPPSEQMGYKH